MEKFEYTGTEKEFLEKYKKEEVQKYEKPSVTVDCVILRYNKNKDLQMLMIQRKGHPFQNKFALPGGFVNKDEDLTQAVIREVYEETQVALSDTQVEQLVTVGTPFRDPRHWIITVAHLVYLDYASGLTVNPQASDDALNVHWVNIDCDEKGIVLVNSDTNEVISEDLVAFDHYSIITQAVERIKGRLGYVPTSLAVLPELNTLSDYRKFYGKFDYKFKDMNSTDFYRKYKQFFTKTDQKVTLTKKPAALYSWGLGE